MFADYPHYISVSTNGSNLKCECRVVFADPRTASDDTSHYDPREFHQWHAWDLAIYGSRPWLEIGTSEQSLNESPYATTLARIEQSAIAARL